MLLSTLEKKSHVTYRIPEVDFRYKAILICDLSFLISKFHVNELLYTMYDLQMSCIRGFEGPIVICGSEVSCEKSGLALTIMCEGRCMLSNMYATYVA